MRKKFEHSLRPSGTNLTFRQQSLFKTPSLIEEIENFLIDKPTLSKNIELHALPKPMRRKFGHSLLPPRTNLSSWNNDVDSKDVLLSFEHLDFIFASQVIYLSYVQ